MPRAPIRLTYDRKNRWWVRVYKKRKHYLLRAESKSDRQTYLAALQKFKEIQASIDASEAGAKRDPVAASTESGLPVRHRRTSDRSKQLRTVINLYLSEYKRRGDTGEISRGRANSVKYWMKGLTDFLGEEFPIGSLNETHVRAYAEALFQERKSGALHVTVLSQKFITLKHFIKWSWQQRMLKEMPRNLGLLKVTVPRQVPLHFKWRKREGHELQRLLNACKERDEFLYLCVLLGLNCGMTLKDIHDLKPSEFMWRQKGYPRIRRGRSKTGIVGSWCLWQTTYDLLKRHIKEEDYGRNDCPLLTMPGGRPIMKFRLCGHSSLAFQFKTVVKEVFGKDDPRTWKHLRKTGAAWAAYRWWGSDSIYLAHAPQTVSARFYVENPTARLDFVLCHAEVRFGLTKTLVKRWNLDDADTEKSVIPSMKGAVPSSAEP